MDPTQVEMSDPQNPVETLVAAVNHRRTPTWLRNLLLIGLVAAALGAAGVAVPNVSLADPEARRDVDALTNRVEKLEKSVDEIAKLAAEMARSAERTAEAAEGLKEAIKAERDDRREADRAITDRLSTVERRTVSRTQ